MRRRTAIGNNASYEFGHPSADKPTHNSLLQSATTTQTITLGSPQAVRTWESPFKSADFPRKVTEL